jgi:hypothetical protein
MAHTPFFIQTPQAMLVGEGRGQGKSPRFKIFLGSHYVGEVYEQGPGYSGGSGWTGFVFTPSDRQPDDGHYANGDGVFNDKRFSSLGAAVFSMVGHYLNVHGLEIDQQQLAQVELTESTTVVGL